MKLPFYPDIKDKTAVVTGGAGILCSMFAQALAQAGAKVAVLDLAVERAQKVAEDIEAEGGKAIAVQVNVLEKDSVEAAHKEVLSKLGSCDILINGAGGNNPKATTDNEYFDEKTLEDDSIKSFFDLDEAGFRFVFDLNLVGTLIPTQVFARDMVKKPGSVIINISSMAAYSPLTKVPAYSSAKAAISNFTQWLAVHFSPANIRVNAIAPGFFSTAQNKALLWNEDGSPTERAGKIINHTPMQRFGQPEELIGTLLYLLDDSMSGFVTGSVIPVDGGFMAYSGV